MGLFFREKNIIEEKLNKNEFTVLKHILTSNDSLINYERLLGKLMLMYSSGVFAGEMPYSVQTAETETPDEWLHDRLSKVFEV
jgi:hypothetical protein